MIAEARAEAYSVPHLRSRFGMQTWRALLVTNDMVSMKPLVVLAIKVLGPGRRRIEMVKLAHDMNEARRSAGPVQPRLSVAAKGRPEVVPAPPSRRAA